MGGSSSSPAVCVSAGELADAQQGAVQLAKALVLAAGGTDSSVLRRIHDTIAANPRFVSGAKWALFTAIAAFAKPPVSGGAGGEEEGEGGCGCAGAGYFGGAADADPAKTVASYANSESAKAKEGVIRAMAGALRDAGIPVDPAGDLDAIVAALKANLPDPRKGKSFSGEAKAQEQVCRALARVFNDHFTPGASGDARLVTGDGAEGICRQVADLARSFTAGTATEFLETFVSLRKALGVLKLLTESMNAAEQEIVAAIDASGDSELARKTENVRTLYEQMRVAQRQYSLVVENLLNVELPPVSAILAKLVEEGASEDARIGALVSRLGTNDFGDGIAASLLGVSRAAAAARIVHKALAGAGLSIDAFRKSESLGALRAQALKLAEADPARLSTVLRSLKAIEGVFDQRADADFERELAGFRGGREARGGAFPYDAPPEAAAARRVKRAKEDKLLVLRAFTTDLAGAYRGFLAAVSELSPGLGKDIPITENTDRLRDAVDRLSATRASEKSIELALIGAHDDADARERRARFLSSLELVRRAVDHLLPLALYRAAAPRLEKLKTSIQAIEQVVDRYARALPARFGGAAEALAVGGGPELEAISAVASVSRLLAEAVGAFRYNYYLAKVGENLAQTSAELEDFGAGYEALLGDAVAGKLYEIQTERTARFTLLVPSAALAGVAPWLPNAGGADANAMARLESVKKSTAAAYDVKTRFYRALQAIDLYLKAFTAGLARSPEAIRGIKSMLEGTQVIARWFNETTGDLIWKAFETCNGIDAGLGASTNAIAADGAAAARVDPGHYYDKIVADGASAGNFGVPLLGVQPEHEDSRTDKIRKNVRDSLDFFQALKNIVNTFVRLGDAFGGKEIHSQVFMSPGQIYKTLFEFLQESAVETAGGANVAAEVNDANIAAAATPYTSFFPCATTADRFFATEDRHFVHVVKAMAGKILTVLGVFDMLERPAPLYDLTPTRMILGGGDSDVVPVAGAAELYFRLPRLAEFYRSVLRWDGKTPGVAVAADQYKVAMLPELDGVFSGLINVVFVQAADPMSGNYSESEMTSLIFEINRIYAHFLSTDPERPVKAALNAFVLEVNRRFGVVKSKDMKEYWELVELERSGRGTGPENNTAYSILPGEDADSISLARRAPSDRFTMTPFQRVEPGTGLPINPETGQPITPFAGRIGIEAGGEHLLINFRTILDDAFRKHSGAFSTLGFSSLVRETSRALEAAAPADRAAIVFRLIQDGRLLQAESSKVLLFHETVIAGLNALCGVESALRRFSNLCTVLDPIRIEGAIADTYQLDAAASRRVASPSDINKGAVVVGGTAATNPGDRAGLLAQIAARLPDYAGAGIAAELGGGTCWFDRYIHGETESVDGRGGLAIASTILYNSVYDAIAREAAAAAAAPIPVGVGSNAAATYQLPSEYLFAAPGGSSIDDPDEATRSGTTASAHIATDRDGGGIPAAAHQVINRQLISSLRLGSRLLTNYGLIFQDFIEAVSALTSSGLARIRFVRDQGGRAGIQLDFSAIRSECDSLLASVKGSLEALRPVIPKAVLDRVESSDNPGSVFWLEKKLFDLRFRGGASSRPESTDGISRRANHVLQALTRKTSAPLHGIAWASINDANPVTRCAELPPICTGAGNLYKASTPAREASRTEAYGAKMSEMVFWNTFQGSSLASNVANTHMLDMGLGRSVEVTSANHPKTWPLIRPLLAAEDAGGLSLGATTTRIPFWSENGECYNKSIIAALNQLLVSYVLAVSDSAPTKIYTPLIDALIGGEISTALASPAGNTIPDFRESGVPARMNGGLMGDPANSNVILHSVALILNQLARAQSGAAAPAPKYLVSTLTDVSANVKESLRARLPLLCKLATSLQDKCDFLASLIDKIPQLSLSRPAQQQCLTDFVAKAPATVFAVARYTGAGIADSVEYPAGDAVIGQNMLLGLDPIHGEKTDEQMRSKLSSLISAASRVSAAMAAAADNVRRELGDSPRFLQTHDGSIESYQSRHGRPPMMPLSSALVVLGNVGRPADGRGRVGLAEMTTPGAAYKTPITDLGAAHSSPDFRLMYGLRGYLYRDDPATPANTPWMQALLGDFAATAGGDTLPAEGAWAAVNRTAQILRKLSVLRNVVPALSASSVLPIAAGLVGTAAPINAVRDLDGLRYSADPRERNTAYQLADGMPINGAVGLAKVTGLTDSSSTDDSVSAIVSTVVDQDAEANGGRDLQRILNLVDMNVVPINIHALMQGIPLANLYNYSYSFDQFVRAALSPSANTPGTAFFCNLLKNPFARVSMGEFGQDTENAHLSPVARLMTGSNGVGMGRPRFLSDQLFNKALFGRIYPVETRADEAGPQYSSTAGRTLRSELASFRDRIKGLLARIDAGESPDGTPMVAASLGTLVAARGRTIVNNGLDADFTGANIPNTLVLLFGNTDADIDDVGYIKALNAAFGFFRTWYDRQTADVKAQADVRAAFVVAGRLLRHGSAKFRTVAQRGTAASYHMRPDAVSILTWMLGTNGMRALVTEIDRPGSILQNDEAPPGLGGPTGTGRFLSYIQDRDGTAALKPVRLPDGVTRARLCVLGKARFDTTFVRKLIFVTNVQRVVRSQLNQALSRDRSVLLSSHASVAASVTEYGADPYTPNEVATSRPRGLNLEMERTPAGQWPESAAGRWADGRE